jgi:tetratricopeptide (TPR) repeat protein
VLNELKRHDEAEQALRRLLQKSPRDEELISQLAESILYQGRPDEAAKMVDEALDRRPRYPRALYVRGRALEAQGELRRAAQTYQYALKSDPGFAPALARIWRLHLHRGEKVEAVSALERLFFLNEASLEERITLAELCAELGMNVERGRRIVDEALARDPNNARYREIRQKLLKAGARGAEPPKGPKIIRGGR